MSDFTIIETQEQFDAAIGERLARERAKYEGFMAPQEVEEKYSGFISPEDLANGYIKKSEVEEQYKDYLEPSKAKEINTKLKAYETNSVKMRIGHEYGIPYEMISRLTGDDEESIKVDAEKLSKFIKNNKPKSPFGEPEPSLNDSKDKKFKDLAKSLRRD